MYFMCTFISQISSGVVRCEFFLGITKGYGVALPRETPSFGKPSWKLESNTRHNNKIKAIHHMSMVVVDQRLQHRNEEHPLCVEPTQQPDVQ